MAILGVVALYEVVEVGALQRIFSMSWSRCHARRCRSCRMRTEAILKDHIRTFDHFLFGDLWTLTDAVAAFKSFGFGHTAAYEALQPNG
jgi:hypothetical protein